MAFVYSKNFEEYLLPHDKNLLMSERNYSKLTSDYLHVLEEKVCKPLVEEFPELGYCEHHYKPLLFVHAHVKAKVERLRKLEAAPNASSSSVTSNSPKKSVNSAKKGTSSGSSSNSSAASANAAANKRLGKRRERTDDQEESTAKKRTKEASRQSAEPNEFDDVYSADEDLAPVTSKIRKKQPIDAVRKLQELYPHSYEKDTDDSDDDTTASTALAAASSYSRANAVPLSSSKAAAASSQSASTSSARPQARKLHKAVFSGTNGTSAEASRVLQHNAAEVSGKDPFTAAAEGLMQMRGNDAAVLIEPDVVTIRSALKDRYSALGKDEADATRLALRAVEMAELCGYIPDGEGEASFAAWLKRLEDAAPDPNDEDNNGPSFGHNLFADFKYRDRLRQIESWGGAKNACRLIRALLRIWAISSEQIKAMPRQPHGPLVRVHIGYVAQLIVDTFKRPTAAPTGSSSKSDFGADVTNTQTATATTATAIAATASSAPDTASSSGAPAASTSAGPNASGSKEKTAEVATKERRRIAKTLQSGKVTEDAIRSLTRKAAVPLLGTSASANVKKANRAQVLDMLVQAWKTGTVTLTAVQIQAARGGAMAEDT
ncbi:hypothetical protein OC835_004284 [Tilletia horrida]|nr:hypothetical protein OC835_004284 [Tilletia horrida]